MLLVSVSSVFHLKSVTVAVEAYLFRHDVGSLVRY